MRTPLGNKAAARQDSRAGMGRSSTIPKKICDPVIRCKHLIGEETVTGADAAGTFLRFDLCKIASRSMSQSLAQQNDRLTAPSFYVTPKQRLGPGSVFLAFLLALACLVAVLYTQSHSRYAHAFRSDASGIPSFGSAGGGSDTRDDDDDPSRVDTIYLGGPSEAPSATRPTGHASAVHPFVVVHLPRSGDQVGQIPDTPAGHLLYNWLAAFNGPDPSAMARALPTQEDGLSEQAQAELRRQTGGFTLVSAKQIGPDVIVFRLHDQTPSTTEVLGTLRMKAGSRPAAIGSFSLRAVSPGPAKAP